jgi:4-hydroxybenzoate polyprenyltransferase
MIYATQDVEADRREGLRSMVVCLGIPGALQLAGWLHLVMLGGLVAFGLLAHLRWIYFLGLLPVPFLLIYEHRIARTLDVSLINKAFFETNAVIGALFVIVITLDSFLGSR